MIVDQIDTGKVIAGALVFVAERRARFAKALAIPFVVYCSLDFAYLLNPGAVGEALVAFLELLAQTVLAISTHRLLLLGDDSIPDWGLTSWGKRELYFVMHLFLVMLCLVPAALLAFIPAVGPILALVAAGWILARDESQQSCRHQAEHHEKEMYDEVEFPLTPTC
ncbi:MAG: hypothetical protein AAGE43_06150, partial [Pseudomonadota bacterium]